MGTMGYNLCRCDYNETGKEVHLSRHIYKQNDEAGKRKQKMDNIAKDKDNRPLYNSNVNSINFIRINDDDNDNIEEDNILDDGPITDDIIAEYFIVKEDLIKNTSISLSRNTQNTTFPKQESSTFAYSNQTNDAHLFEAFIAENYIIDFSWKMTNVACLLEDKVNSDLVFYGDMVITQGYHSHMSAASQLTYFCVLTQKEIKVYRDKEEFAMKMKEMISIEIRNVEQVIMFKEKTNEREVEDNEMIETYMGIVMKANDVNVNTTFYNNHTHAINKNVLVFHNEIRTTICYWTKLLSVLMKQQQLHDHYK